MATWLATNSILTDRGIEILNKLKVGEGSITISRIAASDGRVSDVGTLPSRTALSGTIKEMTLSKVITKGEGSEVSFFISNEGFDTEFHVRQLGIFVQHPDYAGEQLYYIAQCEEDGHDVVPAQDESTITIGYTVYLQHSRDSVITISVSESGSISKDPNVTEGNVPVYAAGGDLQDSGVNLEDLVQEIQSAFHSDSNIVLKSGLHYGDVLPESGVVGRLFFKRVTE